jgi:hypothetical protein
MKLPDSVSARGGGWYEMPSGDKVRGRARVLQALNGSAQNSNGDVHTLQRLDFLRQGGLQYGGSRDVYKVAGYKASPTFDDYWSYYDRHPIAGRIVDMPAQTTWRHAPEIVEPDQEDGTEFTEAFAALTDRLGLWARMERVDRLSRIGQYAVLVIGVRGSADLAMPLTRVSGPDDIVYLAHYSQQAATIDRWVEDSGDPRYGLPEMYKIDLSRKNSTFRPGTRLVHQTRVVHVAEDPLIDDVYGRPVLKRILNTVFNDEKVDAAAAEAFWQIADRILQLNIDPEARTTEADLADLDTKIQAVYHDLRKHFYAQGAELSWLGGDVADPTAISEILATKMAAGANIPKRILFGSERGELASNQDERNYFGMISERQEHHAEPNLLRAFVDRLIDIGGLPRPGDEGYEAQWPDLYVPTEAEKAERNKATADTAKALTPVGGDPYELIEIDDDRNVHLRPSAEVWDEREWEPGEEPEPEPPPMGDEGDEPEPDTEEDEPDEQGAAA